MMMPNPTYDDLLRDRAHLLTTVKHLYSVLRWHGEFSLLEPKERARQTIEDITGEKNP